MAASKKKKPNAGIAPHKRPRNTSDYAPGARMFRDDAERMLKSGNERQRARARAALRELDELDYRIAPRTGRTQSTPIAKPREATLQELAEFHERNMRGVPSSPAWLRNMTPEERARFAYEMNRYDYQARDAYEGLLNKRGKTLLNSGQVVDLPRAPRTPAKKAAPKASAKQATRTPKASPSSPAHKAATTRSRTPSPKPSQPGAGGVKWPRDHAEAHAAAARKGWTHRKTH